MRQNIVYEIINFFIICIIVFIIIKVTAATYNKIIEFGKFVRYWSEPYPLRVVMFIFCAWATVFIILSRSSCCERIHIIGEFGNEYLCFRYYISSIVCDETYFQFYSQLIKVDFLIDHAFHSNTCIDQSLPLPSLVSKFAMLCNACLALSLARTDTQANLCLERCASLWDTSVYMLL